MISICLIYIWYDIIITLYRTPTKLNISFMTYSCQDHKDSLCDWKLPATDSNCHACSTTQSTMHNTHVLFCKKVLNIHIFWGCDLCSAVWDIISYSSIACSFSCEPHIWSKGSL